MQAISSQLPCQDEKIIISINSLSKVPTKFPTFLVSATNLKLDYQPQFGICKFVDRTGSQVVFSCMCTAHCLILARVMSWVRCTATLSFPSPLLLFFVLPYLQLVNRLSQENLMAHLSTFLPALLNAFESHSPYVRKVVNPLPLCSTVFLIRHYLFGHMFLLYFISSNLPVPKGCRNN